MSKKSRHISASFYEDYFSVITSDELIATHHHIYRIYHEWS